jgi:glutathione S-transferase
LMHPLFRRNMGMGAAMLRAARERMNSYFDRLEADIGPSGYLVGDRFGVADLAAASVMTAIIRPPEFPYPLPDPWPLELVELRNSVAGRSGFRWVLDMYARHRGMSWEVAARQDAPADGSAAASDQQRRG